MHVGTPLFILLTSSRFHRLILPIPLNRQRKVKCHQLPGQPKVCLYPLTHLIFSTNRFRPIPSARYSTPLPCLTTDSYFHTQHCMVKNYPCTSVFWLFFLSRRRVNVRLFRHHAQQATSEKKRVSTVSRRPRAYTASSQQRSVFLLFLIRARL